MKEGSYSTLSEQPLNRLGRVGVTVYRTFLTSTNLLNGTLRNFEGREYFEEFIAAIKEGKPARSYPLTEVAKKAYGELAVLSDGGDHIPTNIGCILASNHYPRGVHRGKWQTSVMAQETKRYLPPEQDSRFRVIMKTRLFNYDKLESSQRVPRCIKEFVTNTRLINEQIMRNVAVITDGLVVETDTREIFRTLSDRNFVIVYPSAKEEVGLKRFKEEAGKLFVLANRRGHPVIPVSAWHTDRPHKYFVSFGEPQYSLGKKPPQEAADTIGIEVAKKLPPHLRGYYK